MRSSEPVPCEPTKPPPLDPLDPLLPPPLDVVPAPGPWSLVNVSDPLGWPLDRVWPLELCPPLLPWPSWPLCEPEPDCSPLIVCCDPRPPACLPCCPWPSSLCWPCWPVGCRACSLPPMFSS